MVQSYVVSALNLLSLSIIIDNAKLSSVLATDFNFIHLSARSSLQMALLSTDGNSIVAQEFSQRTR